MAQVKQAFYGNIRKFKGRAAWKVAGNGKTKNGVIKHELRMFCGDETHSRYLTQWFRGVYGCNIQFINWL